MNILFVCRFNRTRSRIAEAYFNKINKNKNLKAKSAGLFKGSAVGKEDIKLAKKFNIDIRGNPQGISSKLLVWQNLIVVTANDVPLSIFKGGAKRVILWKIKDTQYQKNPENLVKEIIKEVNKLSKKLEKIQK
tara:strand:+ start:241 stop:639 length:399 start_codon:yes stop_codon:yes gene_type:complete